MSEISSNQMSNIDFGSTPEEILEHCAKNLELESDIKENALEVYVNLRSELAIDNDEHAWLCCSLYSELQQAKMRDMLSTALASRAQDKRNEHEQSLEEEEQDLTKTNSWNISLTHLLYCFKINITDFLRKMKHWNMLAQHSSTFKQKINVLEHRLGITTLLLHHYKRVFRQLYIFSGCNGTEKSHYEDLYEFGWLLFLVVVNESPLADGANNNLVAGFQLMLCVLELVYVNALEVHASPVINTQFEGVPSGWTEQHFDVSSLAKYSAIKPICQLLPQLPDRGVHVMRQAFFNKALVHLFRKRLLLGDGKVMRALVKDGNLQANLVSLNRSYDRFVADINEMDDRLLLRREQALPLRLKQQQQPDVERQINYSLWQKEAQTFSALQRANLARLLSYGLPSSLPPQLRATIEQDKDDGNLLTNVQNTLRDMALTFGNAALKCTPLAVEACKRRFGLASALYYELLSKIVTAELRRCPHMKVSQLLAQRNFNTTLVACCLQLVLHIGEQAALQFPWVLQCYAIDAYEFQKIIELVVRHNGDLLSDALVKHLRAVEADCLSSHIWCKDGQLWRIYAGQLPSYAELAKPGKENVFRGLVHSTAADICLRKFYALAAQRLNYLCNRLSLLGKDGVYVHLWQILQQCITTHGTALLRQRHLDQLLLCAVYLYARSVNLTMTFSQILQIYRQQSHVLRGIYRAVLLPNGQYDDIIAFYNQAFVPRLGPYIRRWKINQQHSRNSVILQEANDMRANAQRISPEHNIFISPVAKPSMSLDLIAKAKQCMKRAHSDLQLASAAKRPNILRRRTMNE